jgi:hypothetical protein
MSCDTKPEEILGDVKAEVLHVEEHTGRELESTYIPDPIAESKLVRKVRDPIIGCHSHKPADGLVTLGQLFQIDVRLLPTLWFMCELIEEAQ